MEIQLSPHMEKIANTYFENGATKLHKMVDKILYNLHFYDVNNEDFYSLSHEIFFNILKEKNYDESQSFYKYLYSCLYFKFCTEMTGSNRYKRRCVIKVEKRDEYGNIVKDEDGNPVIEDIIITDESIDKPIVDDEDITVGDTIAAKSTIESQFFGANEDGYSRKMQMYLSRLSTLQREVLRLISIGFLPNEIIEELHIDQKTYEDCYKAIHSYRNTSILL